MEYKVKKIKTEENNIIISKEDYEENTYNEHVLINNITVYKLKIGLIKKGYIGINEDRYNYYCLDRTSIIRIDNYEIKDGYNKRLRIKIETNEMIDKEDIEKKIRTKYKNHYFYPQQVITIDKYIGIIRDEGYINKDTEIEYENSNIINKYDILKDNYNYNIIGIGGLNREINIILKRIILTRLYDKETINKLGIKHIKGLILYGPPGTGKTLIAKKISNIITKVEPKIVNGPEILNKYIGESERQIRELFEEAEKEYKEKGEESDTHIIIFDEIDSICKKRQNNNDTIVNQLLTKIDGINNINNIIIIGITNRIDLIDQALLRCGRLELHVYIGLPDKKGREEIFNIHLKNIKDNNLIENIDMNKIIELTNNFTGAEIESVIKIATTNSLYRKINNNKNNIIITEQDIIDGIKEVITIYGNKLIIKENNISDNLIDYKKNIEEIVNKKNKNTILIYGKKGSGKTSLIKEIIKGYNGYIKYVDPIEIVSLNEINKSIYLTTLLKDIYNIKDSIIIMDDIETIINYVNINDNISYSNMLYQTLISMIKANLNKDDIKLNIIVSTSSEILFDSIKKSFDLSIYI